MYSKSMKRSMKRRSSGLLSRYFVLIIQSLHNGAGFVLVAEDRHVEVLVCASMPQNELTKQ